MRTWAIFLYGLAVGVFFAWVAISLIDELASKWLLIGSAAALAAGLLVNQRAISRSKGRRWRKTI